MQKSIYAQAGVDFGKEHAVVDVMRKVGRETAKNIRDLKKYGITLPDEESDFAGGFQLDLENLVSHGVKKMVVSGGVDGPGTGPVDHAIYNGDDPVKLGCTNIDSIAMGANDVICNGARPFIGFEYHSWHNTNVEVARQMGIGKVIGAELAKMAIIGGENASLSIMITGPVPDKAYDMCHTVLGIIMDQELIDHPLGKGRVEVGDSIIGLSSSGVHSNGLTLILKTAIDYEKKGFNDMHRLNDYDGSLGESAAEAILTPTIIYANPVLKTLDKYGDGIKAVANISGEGVHNIRRVLPEQTGLMLNYSRPGVQEPHPIFGWVMENANVPVREMMEVYNNGTGMVMIVNPSQKNQVINHLNKIGRKQKYPWQEFKAYDLGEVIKDPQERIAVAPYWGGLEIYQKNK